LPNPYLKGFARNKKTNMFNVGFFIADDRRRIIEQPNDSVSDSEACEIPTGGLEKEFKI